MNIAIAEQVIGACVKQSARIGKPVAAVVVDLEGRVVMARRADGVRDLVLQLATSKAYTAAIMERPTLLLEQWAHLTPDALARLSSLGPYPIMTGPGGFVIKQDSRLLGAFGVSGARGDEDQAIGDAVLDELGFETDFAAFD
ncbi:GlcG/HbpS family heme-binding protein [Streptomyces prunicolor]|uniref:GlcG/HbpS family heme-binding protein n=1 Tax=Streptomyces prunicolor TaxID=67348 RepID=UPI00343F5E90